MQTYCSSPSEEFPHTGKPKLLIIELDYHAEVLTTLCPILAQRFDLVLWTTDKIWHKTCLPEQLFATTLIMPKKHSVRRFWQRHQNILSKVDLIYFNTLEKHFAFFARLNFACPTIMRIHCQSVSRGIHRLVRGQSGEDRLPPPHPCIGPENLALQKNAVQKNGSADVAQ
jgi:hypothetical protein